MQNWNTRNSVNKILLLLLKEHLERCCVVLCRTRRGQKTCAGRQERNAPDNKILLLNKRTCKTVLHDFRAMGRTALNGRGGGGGGWGRFSVSSIQCVQGFSFLGRGIVQREWLSCPNFHLCTCYNFLLAPPCTAGILCWECDWYHSNTHVMTNLFFSFEILYKCVKKIWKESIWIFLRIKSLNL
jgi:hypothetical protein